MAAGLENALSGPPFVGRRPEIARIQAAYTESTHTGRQVACEVVGDPGIGKTRLVHAALDRCAPTLPRAVGTCVEAEQDIPFHVFRHAFGALHPAGSGARRQAVGGIDAAGALVPREAGPLDVRLFRTYQLARRLLTLAARDGLALVLDDLHWADPSSTGLVTHLLRYPVPVPLLLLLVYRPRQTATVMPFGPPEPGVPAGRFRDRIELGPLSPAETVELYPDSDPAELAERHDRAGGNPGYLAALADTPPVDADRAVALPVDADRAVALPSGPSRLTDRAVATLRAEWAGLPSVDAVCLRAAAVLDTPCAVDLLAEVAQLPTPVATEAAWRLVRRDLLRAAPAAAGFAFRHPVLRTAVRQDTDVAWRVEAQHRALDALVARGAPPAARVAQVEALLTLPHDRPVGPYVDVLCRAAQEIRRDAPDLAVRWLRTALRALRPPAGSPTSRHDVTLLLARITGEAGNLAESRALLREVVPELPADPGGRRARAVAQWVRVERLLGNYAEAAAISRRELIGTPTRSAGTYQLATELGAVGILSGHPAPMSGDAPDGDASGIDRAGLLAVRGLAAAHDGAVDLARDLLATSAPIVDALPDRDLRDHPDCLLALGLAELFLERPTDATRHLDRGIALVRDAHRDDGLCQLLLGRSQVAYHRGQLGTVIGLTTEAGIVARRIGSRSLLSFALAFEAQATAWRGGPRDDERAVALARGAVELATDLDSWSGRTAATALATATLLAGDPDTCVEMLTDAGGDGRLTRLQASLRPMWHELLCAAALAGGDLAEAERRAREAMAAADLIDLSGQRAFAESAYGEVLLARGEVAAAMPYLRTAADRFRMAGMTLRHSLALVAVARAAEAVDQGGPAARARQQALDLAVRCGTERVGLRLTRPVRALAETALTDREWHIARLASTGVTNRLIGRRLHISPRTVEAHLTRIYRKAGVESRSGLVAWVSRFDDTDR
ncbi:LuxR family transcriptional regulator [Micromonospora sp. WMMD987]|uniref:AAA family ATPase n=1 Tax=Micromonospora sp. WMMD987 TaxID=3016089 RepID=UPI00249CC7F0|nr:LuxR family transcriptional regulator [Micromonospora sp. WMMD987]WFE92884.1 AAA family ATPase [Micromonospora sp. WMMD987]